MDSHSTATAALSNALQHVEWMTTEVCNSMGESGSRPMHTESAAAIHTLAVMRMLDKIALQQQAAQQM